MISEKNYNELLKAQKNAEYLAMLDKSSAEAKAGGFIVKSLEELEKYEEWIQEDERRISIPPIQVRRALSGG